MATSTCTVELQPLQVPAPTKNTGFDDDSTLRPECFAGDGQRLVEECATPHDAPPGAALALQQWNNPRDNMYRLAACFWCFMVMGANDAAYGVSAFKILYSELITDLCSHFFNLYVLPIPVQTKLTPHSSSATTI